MTSDSLRLDGCRPTPLASYLKALGVLRLVAEQADEKARGYWDGERFHLKTTLDRDGLRRFFLEDYAPTPIIAPWNGRGGFLEPDDASDEDDAPGSNGRNAPKQSTRRSGELRRAYEEAAHHRFHRLRTAVIAFASVPTMNQMAEARTGWKDLEKRSSKRKWTNEETEEHRKFKKLEEVAKENLLDALRSEVDEEQCVWLDACIWLADGAENSPLLLGGGSDGSRDYGMSFGLALQKLFQFEDGCAKEGRDGPWLCAALFGDVAPLGGRDSFGYLFPGQSGYNATTGFELAKSRSPLNPWDMVLALEGAVLWSGGVTRRLENAADASAASFPFCVEMSRSGAGQLSTPDRNRAPGEVWCPIWSRPTGLPELRSLFREGRLTLGKRSARNGLDAALAVAGLGRSRGITSFVRVGLYQSDAKMPHTAAPLRRLISGSAPGAASIGAELAEHWWISSLRRYARTKEAPAVLPDGIRALEDALFEFAARPGQGAPPRPDAAQEVLIAFGLIGRLIATRSKLQEVLSPPPILSAHWTEAADDGSAEFRVAAALAGLRARMTKTEDDGARQETGQDVPRYGLYMRQHLAPLDPDRPEHPAWGAASGKALAVWGPGALVDNLCAAAQRRLVTVQKPGLADKPFHAPFGADSATVAAFLDASESFDRRVAELLAGLIWVEPARPRGSPQVHALPLAYATLKPLFAPGSALREAKRTLPEDFTLPIPPALAGLLMADRVNEALQLGLARARSSGLPVPFSNAQVPATRRFGRRLLAALTIPVMTGTLHSCLDQAYPPEEDTEHAA